MQITSEHPAAAVTDAAATDAAVTDAAARASARLGVLVPELVAIRAEIARLQAREAEVLAAADAVACDWAAEADLSGRSEAEMTHRATAAEIAAAWRVSDRTVQRGLGDATLLVTGFPATHASLAAGRISLAHARVIVAAGAPIERDEVRALYEEAVLPYAEAESATRLAPIARRRAEWYGDTTFAERHEVARLRRRVVVTDLDDGMAELCAVLPATLAHGIHDRLTQFARAGEQAARDAAGAGSGPGSAMLDGLEPEGDSPGALDDRRTLDERRADVFADLLLAGDPTALPLPTGVAAIRATVQVTVPVLSLIGADVADPFEELTLDGHGPIDASTARALAAGAPGWDRILTHPITGAVLAVDRYRPSDQMRRHLRVRDQHCRFPGCRLPARYCDLDHLRDHALGGETDTDNLANLCRRHHMVKHHSPWQVRHLGAGMLEWTSPAGHRYTDHPVSTVAFVTDPEDDPVFAPAPF